MMTKSAYSSLQCITAAAGSDLGFSLRPLFKPSSDQLGLMQDGNSAKLDDHRVLILVGSTLATNVLSTSLIGIQVWWVSVS